MKYKALYIFTHKANTVYSLLMNRWKAGDVVAKKNPQWRAACVGRQAWEGSSSNISTVHSMGCLDTWSFHWGWSLAPGSTTSRVNQRLHSQHTHRTLRKSWSRCSERGGKGRGVIIRAGEARGVSQEHWSSLLCKARGDKRQTSFLNTDDFLLPKQWIHLSASWQHSPHIDWLRECFPPFFSQYSQRKAF